MIRAAVVAFSFNSLKLWRIPRHLKFCLPPRRRVMYFVRNCSADGKCRIPVRATTGSKYAVGGRCTEIIRPLFVGLQHSEKWTSMQGGSLRTIGRDCGRIIRTLSNPGRES